MNDRVKEILGRVIIRDAQTIKRTAEAKKTSVSSIEQEGCLNRARQYGVEQAVLKILSD